MQRSQIPRSSPTPCCHVRAMRIHPVLVYGLRAGNYIHASRVAPVSGSQLPHLKHFGLSRDFVERYNVSKHIGSGSFGSVSVAVDKKTGHEYAVKTIKKVFHGEWIEPRLARRIQHEVDIYHRLGQSLNVVHLYGAFEDDNKVDLVLELCTGGELQEHIKRARYNEHEAAFIIQQVLLAIAQCHSAGIVLRDVKPDNFLYLNGSEGSPLKLIDFGLAEYCKNGEHLTERYGSPYYVAPEVLKQCYDTQCDCWSAGIMAYELFTGRLPFLNEDGEPLVNEFGTPGKQTAPSTKELNAAILYGDLGFHLEPWASLNPGCRDLVQSLLARDPQCRPSAREALLHPWLVDIRAASEQARYASSDSLVGVDIDSVCSMGRSLVQILQSFGTSSQLRRVALTLLAQVVEEEQPTIISIYRVSPGSFITQDGRISRRALIEYLSSNECFSLSSDEAEQLLEVFLPAAAGQDSINPHEWLAALVDWTELQKRPEWTRWVKSVFNIMDKERTGTIDLGDLDSVICGPNNADRHDEICSFPDVIPSVLREIGHYEDPSTALIGFEEFYKLITEESVEPGLFDDRSVLLGEVNTRVDT